MSCSDVRIGDVIHFESVDPSTKIHQPNQTRREDVEIPINDIRKLKKYSSSHEPETAHQKDLEIIQRRVPKSKSVVSIDKSEPFSEPVDIMLHFGSHTILSRDSFSRIFAQLLMTRKRIDEGFRFGRGKKAPMEIKILCKRKIGVRYLQEIISWSHTVGTRVSNTAKVFKRLIDGPKKDRTASL